MLYHNWQMLFCYYFDLEKMPDLQDFINLKKPYISRLIHNQRISGTASNKKASTIIIISHHTL